MESTFMPNKQNDPGIINAGSLELQCDYCNRGLHENGNHRRREVKNSKLKIISALQSD